MQHRRLGRTGLGVSAIALDTRGLDGEACPDLDAAEAAAAMALAFERGINAVVVDPAAGGSEAAVGEILKRQGRQGAVHVLAKIPPAIPLHLPSGYVEGQQAFPGAHVRAVTEASLKALGVERLALQQLTFWTPEWLHEGDWLETLHRLREEGKIAAIGLSLFDHDPGAGLEAVDSGAVDCVETAFNVFDQGPAAMLLPLCRRRDVGVVARSPLYAGALTPRIEADEPFAPGDWRRGYFYDEHLAETRERAARLAGLAEPPERGLADLALRFCLSHPAVSTVAVGMRTRAHVAANLAVLEQGPMAPERLNALVRERWLC